MTTESGSGTPKSPEVQEPYVRDELDQDMITHQGDYRKPPANPQMRHKGYLGATEDENVPVLPPMSGPADLLGEEDVDGQGNETGKTRTGEEMIDPREELTPG
ncbi:MAG: hypothetical protein ACJ78Q_08515 [Chloroflexia bacterium]